MQQRKLHLLAAALAAAALLAGCGGGGGDEGPRTEISRVVVAGDSLADSGTFGTRITVQNSENPADPFPVFTDIVARNFGLGNLCPAFIATSGSTFAPTLRAGCTNFAVSASRIVANSTDAEADPQEQTVPFQLATAGQAIGTYTANDLVLVDGGGNDSGDLLIALSGAQTGVQGQLRYQAFLLQQLTPTELAATSTQPNPAVVAAVAYMRKLAGTYYNAVKVNALDRGATHVAILDMPDISLTPRVQAGLPADATARATAIAALRAWTDAFNAQLRDLVGSDERVVIVPFNADFTEEVNNASTFGLSNVTTPACLQVGIASFGSGTASPANCTSAALDANPPAGLAPGWWRTWAFADGFHPTPFGHQLLAASVNRALARGGIL